MNYDSIIDLERVTLQDCIELEHCKNIHTIINDGRIINFEKEDNDEV